MDSVYIVPLFCDEHSCQNGLIQQQAPCLHYTPSIQLHRLFYLGRMLGREGAARTEEKNQDLSQRSHLQHMNQQTC